MIKKDKDGILLWPNVILTQRADRVVTFDTALKNLVFRMATIIRDRRALGLAAPQLGILQRVFLMRRTDDRIISLINPTISLDGPTELGREGCLSFPKAYNYVERATTAILSYQDSDGNSEQMELEGLEARIAQHEYDHLEGVLFIDRMSRQMRRQTIREYEKESKAQVVRI